MELVGLRSFLVKNGSEKNTSFVFPSPKDIDVSDSTFISAITTRGDKFDAEILDFFKKFIRELYQESVGEILLAILQSSF